MFGSVLLHLLMTYENKKFLKYSVLQGDRWKVLGFLCKFLICGSKLLISDGYPAEINL